MRPVQRVDNMTVLKFGIKVPNHLSKRARVLTPPLIKGSSTHACVLIYNNIWASVGGPFSDEWPNPIDTILVASALSLCFFLLPGGGGNSNTGSAQSGDAPLTVDVGRGELFSSSTRLSGRAHIATLIHG